MEASVEDISRREFLATVPVVAGIMLVGSRVSAQGAVATSKPSSRIALEPFDYRGVTLRDSRWKTQYLATRDFYLNVSDDDILKGYRTAAGMPAPGETLGGWARVNTNEIFGQWLSGMARMYRATGDDEMRAKAVRLMHGWAQTFGPDGDCRMDTYAYDKAVCGLVDLHLYADVAEAIPILENITRWGDRTFSRERSLHDRTDPTTYYGLPHEWYTLSENLYRAYQATGNPEFKNFAEVWLYPAYWNKFADTNLPPDAQGAHAYSHCNTFSSAAMAYEVTGDPQYLRIITNAYEYFQNTQCFATGGYGPTERLMTPDGCLGKSLDSRPDTAETPCGTWAAFKLSRYLTRFTGRASYGDWMERMLYNGIGAMPVPKGRGEAFYYADYRVAGGVKSRYWEAYPCCSGTYIQDVVDYHNIIYYKDDNGLYVNMYVPSEVTWSRADGNVHVVQDTAYPEESTSTLTLAMDRPSHFTLSFRVPEWSRGVTATVNGTPTRATFTPGTWGQITREWQSGDRVVIDIPLRMRLEPVDKWHPNRVAAVRGPVVLVLAGDYQDPAFNLPMDNDALDRWLIPNTRAPGTYRVQPPGGHRVAPTFQPFYAAAEDYPYKMYFDRDIPVPRLW
jgi:hypothetical protein